jgi:hypothetical protein
MALFFWVCNVAVCRVRDNVFRRISFSEFA